MVLADAVETTSPDHALRYSRNRMDALRRARIGTNRTETVAPAQEAPTEHRRSPEPRAVCSASVTGASRDRTGDLLLAKGEQAAAAWYGLSPIDRISGFRLAAEVGASLIVIGNHGMRGEKGVLPSRDSQSHVATARIVNGRSPSDVTERLLPSIAPPRFTCTAFSVRLHSRLHPRRLKTSQ
jgi:hypothetical protein